MNPLDIYNTYFKGRVSYGYFMNVWTGSYWKTVHMDVYTEENRNYYKLCGNERSYRKMNLTDDQIMELRKRYVDETAEEIYESVAADCSLSSFRGMLSGNSYKHLPYYDKKKKEWVN